MFGYVQKIYLYVKSCFFSRALAASIVFLWFNVTNSQYLEVCKTCDVKTLSAAIQKATPNTTIFLKKGIYKEHNIVINKPLQIKAEKQVIIDGQNKGHILIVKADHVSISGLTLRNVGQSYTKDYAAIYIDKCRYFSIKNMALEHVFFGILVEKSHHGRIENNIISGQQMNQIGAGNGIHLWHSSNVTISKNELYHVRDGIYFEFVSDSKITYNNSHDNFRYGLHFMFSNNDEYHHNTFSKNGSGVAVMFSKFIKMTHNIFSKNWGTASYGLLLKEIYDAEIEENTFEQNTVGLLAEGSTRINYKRNHFLNNGWGIKISGACYTNQFLNNNFIGNAMDLSYKSALNDNSFNQNYWSSYVGYDLDKNGFGDVPYRPVTLFSYIINDTPEAIILLRSLFVDLINFSEKVSPIFTPDNLFDSTPLMRPIK